MDTSPYENLGLNHPIFEQLRLRSSGNCMRQANVVRVLNCNSMHKLGLGDVI